MGGGGTLAARRASPLPSTAAAELVERLARAVQHAHDQGVIHRDLKDVLLDSAGGPKVTDFGVTKLATADHGLTAHRRPQVPSEGAGPALAPDISGGCSGRRL